MVQQLLQEQVGALLGQNSLDQVCRQYCKRHAGTSLLHAAAAAQGLVLLDAGAASEAAALVTDFDISQGELPAPHVCLLAVRLVGSLGAGPAERATAHVRGAGAEHARTGAG